jgi:UDP-4-amino-4,6-dideoxy-N-acetyl-beta-L-altrosamine N-acetyltransferase
MFQVQDYSLDNVREEDLPLILKWRNSDHIRKFMYSDHKISEKEHYDWYRNLKNDSTKIYKVFKIKVNSVGMIYFTDIDWKNGVCKWGFYLGEENLPKGTGTIMGIVGLEYAFKKLNLRKICGEVLDFNIPSIRFHEKLGFKEEGRLVKHVYKNNKLTDVLLFGLLSEDWNKISEYMRDKYIKRL